MTNEENAIMAFYEYLAKYMDANPQQRRGQALFNVLHEVRPELADQIHATNLDPFFHDDRVADAHTFIYQNW